MKLYKGFNKGLKCRDFQYEIGKTYTEETADLCKKGFHACENPLDTFNYYSPGDGSRYCEVEMEGVSNQKDNDTKRCGKVIKIGAELTVSDICKAHFEYVKSQCNPVEGRVAGDGESVSVGEKTSASAGNKGSASAGNWGSASAGYKGSASAGDSGSASAGYMGIASAGYMGIASAGNWGIASAGESGSASAGNWGIASAGDSGSASAGYKGSASAGENGSASAGNRGSASAGYKGSASAGENGLACCRGGKVKGGIGCAICCAELDSIGNNIGVAAAIVDGEKIKANTWYSVKNGKFYEVKE